MKNGLSKTARFILVGVQGFEPWTPWSQTRCATGLRYTPRGKDNTGSDDPGQSFTCTEELLESFQYLLNNKTMKTKTTAKAFTETNAVHALSALAQATRLRIFRVLLIAGNDGMAAGVLASTLDIAPSALSFHLKELTHAGLIQPRQDGRFMIYSANFSEMNALIAYLTENCCRGSESSCSIEFKPKKA
jgi:ArsR family transcriptional regulator, arsenate/arsenite/antimonite-responsive transcriptional repressor